MTLIKGTIKKASAIALFSVLAACSTRPVDEASHVSQSINWLHKAEQAVTEESFALAVNHLIQSNDEEAFLQLYDYEYVINGWDIDLYGEISEYSSLYMPGEAFYPGFNEDWDFLNAQVVREYDDAGNLSQHYYKMNYQVSTAYEDQWIGILIRKYEETHDKGGDFFIFDVVNNGYVMGVSQAMAYLNYAMEKRDPEPIKGRGRAPAPLSVSDFFDAYKKSDTDFLRYVKTHKINTANPVVFLLRVNLAGENPLFIENWDGMLSYYSQMFPVYRWWYMGDLPFDEQEAMVDRMVRITGDFAYFHTVFARMLIENGQYEEALKHLRQSIEYNPGYFLSYLELIKLYSLTEEFSPAVTTLAVTKFRFETLLNRDELIAYGVNPALFESPAYLDRKGSLY